MKNKSLFRVASVIALVTIFSKFVGFFRDVIIAKVYGATFVSDAYFYAYQFPALAIILLGGLGGPFHTATVAIFTKAIPDLQAKPEQKVQKAFNTFVTATGLCFAVIAVLLFYFSDQIIGLIASGAGEELKTLASAHLKIMSPIVLIGGVIGIFYGIANVYKEFFFTSLSPTVLSVVIILSLVLAPVDQWGYTLAWATLAGAIGQLLIQLPIFIKSGFFFKPEFDFSNDNIKKIGEILFPAMLGTTIGQINIYVDMFFASGLEEGAWSAIGYANRIFQFPVGVMITALLVPLFPMFSTYVAKKDFSSLRNYFRKGLNTLWFVSFPVLALILMFSYDGVRLLFQRGAFDATDTLMVSEALFYLSLSIIPYVARDTLTRVFYSFDDSKTPFKVAIISIFVKTLMNFLLVGPLGIGGITLSTTIVTVFNALLLALLIREKIGLGYLKLISPISKTFAATLIMSALIYIANQGLINILPDNYLYLFIRLIIIALLSLFIYFFVSIKLKSKPAIDIANKVRKS